MFSVIANVVEIEAVQPHPNADRLFLAGERELGVRQVRLRGRAVLQGNTASRFTSLFVLT